MSRRAVPAVVLVPLLVVALVVSTSACGTMANFNGGVGFILQVPPDAPPPPVAYGGVQWDVERAVKSEATASEKALIFPVWLLELSLSATLDTATLPIVFWINARQAWGRMSENPTFPDVARPSSGEPKPPGWYPDPYKHTSAERILNPSPAEDEDLD